MGGLGRRTFSKPQRSCKSHIRLTTEDFALPAESPSEKSKKPVWASEDGHNSKDKCKTSSCRRTIGTAKRRSARRICIWSSTAIRGEVMTMMTMSCCLMLSNSKPSHPSANQFNSVNQKVCSLRPDKVALQKIVCGLRPDGKALSGRDARSLRQCMDRSLSGGSWKETDAAWCGKGHAKDDG